MKLIEATVSNAAYMQCKNRPRWHTCTPMRRTTGRKGTKHTDTHGGASFCLLLPAPCQVDDKSFLDKEIIWHCCWLCTHSGVYKHYISILGSQKKPKTYCYSTPASITRGATWIPRHTTFTALAKREALQSTETPEIKSTNTDSTDIK